MYLKNFSPAKCISRFQPYILLFSVMMITLSGCARLPGHYIELNRCIEEHSPIGEEFLVAFSELEGFLLDEGHLTDTTKDAYRNLLLRMANEEISISAYNTAPHVRDFWSLQEQGTIGSYLTCTRQVSEKREPDEARSAHQLREVFDEMSATGNYSHSDSVTALVDAIRDEDFDYVLYRSAPLAIVVYMMEKISINNYQ